MNLCVIPGRGGSKRIYKKNIIPFLGKPIIGYAIKKALDSGLFDEVMVSTDDEEIKAIAIEFGAKVPFLRSEMASNDFATTTDVLIEVIKSYSDRGVVFTNVCCLYPTSVLVSINILIEGFKLLNDYNTDAVITMQKFHHPIQRALVLNKEKLNWVNEEYEFYRTQDLKETYFDCGQFYWLKVKQFLLEKKLLLSNSKGLLLSDFEAHDIDIISDLNIAEIKYLATKTHEKNI